MASKKSQKQQLAIPSTQEDAQKLEFCTLLQRMQMALFRVTKIFIFIVITRLSSPKFTDLYTKRVNFTIFKNLLTLTLKILKFFLSIFSKLF